MGHNRKLVACTAKIIHKEEGPDQCEEIQAIAFLGDSEQPLLIFRMVDGSVIDKETLWSYDLHYEEATIPLYSVES